MKYSVTEIASVVENYARKVTCKNGRRKFSSRFPGTPFPSNLKRMRVEQISSRFHAKDEQTKSVLSKQHQMECKSG